MAQKHFVELQCRMLKMDISRAYLAEKLGYKVGALNRRFRGEKTFDLDEIYAICKYLHIPREEILDYFPAKAEEKKRTTLRIAT